MNQITLDHCKTALSQTRACLDREHHIALAVMCGVTFERFMAYDANKTFESVRRFLNKDSDWDKYNRSLGNQLLDIRNKAVHAEYAHKFDPKAEEQALEAWALLRGLIPILTSSSKADIKPDMRTVIKNLIAPPLK